MIGNVGASRVATTRTAKFISRHINWKLDPLLLRLSHGRVATTLVFPTALLETTGAKTGLTRRNAVIYFHDNERVTIIASNAGAPHHPAWYHNLLAHPDITLASKPMHATLIDEPAERERIWTLADRVFPAFSRYRDDANKTGRTIPIIQLKPRQS